MTSQKPGLGLLLINLLLILLTVTQLAVPTTSSTSLKEATTLFEHDSHISDFDQKQNALTKTGRKLNVLLLTTAMSVGHVSPLLAVGEELTQRGHSVTLCSTHTLNKKEMLKKMSEKVGVSFLSAGVSMGKGSTKLDLDKKGLSFTFAMMGAEVKTVSDFFFKEFPDPEKLKDFDFILYADLLHYTAKCLNHRYSIPIMMISTLPDMFSDTQPSWPFPNTIAGDLSDDLSFFDRIKVLAMTFTGPFIENKMASELSKPLVNFCPNMSYHFSPSPYHPVLFPTAIGFEYSRTLWPMSTYVGPLLTKNPDPLSNDLKSWLDKHREKSVMYISMGSHINILEETGRAFIEGILKTKYDAVWALRKENQEILDGLDINKQRIFVISWAPQLSVLQHKAISLAIVHGGFNGIHESLYNGVPLIVVPLFLNNDQVGNGARVRYQGLGVMLDYRTLTAEKITNSISKFDSGDYRRNVERLQKIFVSAGGVEKAADLVEYYKEVGYDHLIPSYAKYEWSWVQYYNVDVYTLLAVILVSVIYCSLKCCQFVCRRTCCKRKEKKD